MGSVMSGLSRARQAFRGRGERRLAAVCPPKRGTKRATHPGIFDGARRLDACVEASAIPAAAAVMIRHEGEDRQMMKKAAMILLALGMGASASAREGDVLVRFDGGIGVQPVANVAGPANADGTFPNVKQNVVRGVLPGTPWRIADLRADIRTDGRIRVRGRGLLLASGNTIGQNGNASVFATLFCEATGPFVEHSTTVTVPLELNGDFRIDDTLNSVPSDCPSPVLLIRNSNGVWFAAGIPKLDDEDR